MILVSVTVSDPAAQISTLGAGALLRLERGDAEGGPFTEFATVALASDVNVYDVWDPEGDEDSWYRTRFSEADGSNPTSYAAAFQAGEQSYASRTDLLRRLRMTTADSRFLDAATDALAETTRDLIREVGFSYFRQPLTGTETVIFDGNGTDLLHVHGAAPRVGVISVTTVQIRTHVDDAWISLDADEWRLEGNPGSTGVEPGDPYFHVRILSHSTYRTFPRGTNLVRLVDAVFGWSAIQPDHREANIALARQRLGADPSIAGGPLGPDELGTPFVSDRWPRAVYDLVLKESMRHECWR